jgi:hypothetical protein
VAGLSLRVVTAGSKVVVLELVHLVFGDAVSLVAFVPVTLLVVILLLPRNAVRRLLNETAEAAEPSSASGSPLCQGLGLVAVECAPALVKVVRPVGAAP